MRIMQSNSKYFNVGDVECIAVTDGTFSYPTAWLFSNVAQDELDTKFRERNIPIGNVESPYTCLLIKSGKHKLLIDTGADGLAPTTGNLFRNLQVEGVSPEEITEVVLTHAHPDHIGGTLDASGKPAFPNARYIMSKTEWDFWNDPSVLHDVAMDDHTRQLLVGTAQKNLPPLLQQIELLEGEQDIIPGVRAIPAPGHTPGHIAVLISSPKAQMLHIADTVLHPLNLEYPGWRNVFDLDPQGAMKTRERLFDRAVADGGRALAYHFPSSGLGTIVRHGNAFRWEAGE
jgi:glyoxylase-like metal-dependent hydrolase (beta-lactamase superfamily II)